MKLVRRRPPGAEVELGKSAGAYSDQSAGVLAGILESADELFAAIDADLRFVAFNATFRRIFTAIFGQAPALGQPLSDALAGFSDQQRAVIDIAQRAFGGEALKLDQEIAVAGAAASVFEINVTPVLNTGGRTVVVAIVGRDITARREAEVRFRKLVEASPDAMLIVRGGQIELLSAQAEALFGYPAGALLGQPLEVLVPEPLREQHLRDRLAYAHAPRKRPMGNGLRLSARRADGSELPVEISLSPLSLAGEVVVAAAIRDISARRQIEDQLRQRGVELEAQVAALQHRIRDLEAGLQRRERSEGVDAEHFRAVFEEAAVGIAITMPDGRILRSNAAFCAMLGYAADALQGFRMYELTHPDDRDVDMRLDNKILSGALASYNVEKRFLRRDGSLIWGAVSVSVKRDANGAAQYFVVVLKDVTRRMANERKLGETQLRLQLAVEIARLGFWEWNPETGDAYFSPEWKQQLGLGERRLPVTFDEWQARLHPEDRESTVQVLQEFAERPQGELVLEYRMRHEDGSYRWFASRGLAIRGARGKVAKVIGTRVDVSERKETEKRIRQACQHDPLTGLPNRALLFEYAEHLLANARRGRTQLAVFFIDLDRFKEINDTFGHEAGDGVLRVVAERLLASIRKGDVAARLGGDEFLVILPEVADAAGAARVAEHVLVQLNRPYPVKGRDVTMSPSIGISFFPQHGDDPDTLIRCADHAMYDVKQGGGSRIGLFSASDADAVAPERPAAGRRDP